MDSILVSGPAWRAPSQRFLLRCLNCYSGAIDFMLYVAAVEFKLN